MHTCGMKTRFTPLLELAVTEFFNEIGQNNIIPQTSTGYNNPVGIFILIGFTGQFKGFLTFTSCRQTAENLSRQLHEQTEMPFTPSQAVIKSTMGEIVNILAGKLLAHLEKQNIVCNITPPTIFLGTNLENDYADLQTCASINITGTFGKFKLDFVLKT